MKVTNVFIEDRECVGYVIYADSFAEMKSLVIGYINQYGIGFSDCHGEIDPRRANYVWPREAEGYNMYVDLRWGNGDIVPV